MNDLASATSQEYVFKMNETAGAPILNEFWGKITIYRRLAEHTLKKLRHSFQYWRRMDYGCRAVEWDFAVEGVPALTSKFLTQFPFLTSRWAARLIKGYAIDTFALLGDAKSADDLGASFGATLTEQEATWLIEKELARTAGDIVWHRSKLGLRMKVDEIAAPDDWLASALAQ